MSCSQDDSLIFPLASATETLQLAEMRAILKEDLAMAPSRGKSSAKMTHCTPVREEIL